MCWAVVKCAEWRTVAVENGEWKAGGRRNEGSCFGGSTRVTQTSLPVKPATARLPGFLPKPPARQVVTALPRQLLRDGNFPRIDRSIVRPRAFTCVVARTGRRGTVVRLCPVGGLRIARGGEIARPGIGIASGRPRADRLHGNGAPREKDGGRKRSCILSFRRVAKRKPMGGGLEVGGEKCVSRKKVLVLREGEG